ncbi:MAG: hypothetical protein MRJ96_00930 [Nitrospirales bacterium]|nr:hypothetical protein [Nitrospira sp.]MDR4500005.1 hypothetical protein [Nitrospirales bacterium]
MIKQTSRIFRAMMLVSLITLWGCDDSPKPDLSKAQQALEHARQAGAEESAPDLFAEAMKSLQEAADEIQSQDDAFWLFRDYAKAEELLAKVEDKAKQAESKITSLVDRDTASSISSNDQHAQNDVMLAVSQARKLIGEAKAMLSQAPSGKDVEIVLEMMENDIYAAESTLAEIPKEIAPQDYSAVTEKAEKVRGVASRIRDQILQAIEKTQDRNP